MNRATAFEPRVLSASTIIGDKVVNPEGETLGKIEEIMLDMAGGRISYIVLSFGGILGMGDKFFAIPFEALTLDAENHQFILNVDKETLKHAPGFDKNNWPNSADRSWLSSVYSYYGFKTYW